MKGTAIQNYHARMQRVLDHIDQHLDDDLGLDVLGGVAAFSKHHFHRQFTASFGVSPHRYVHLLRMNRASHRLAFRKGQTVTDIALAAGYEVPEAFGRSFKENFGQTPTAFRVAPEWAPWLAAFAPLSNTRTKLMTTQFSADQVKIVDTAAIVVAVMEHRGDPVTIGDTIQRLIAWRKANRLPPTQTATFNVFHTDPRTTRAADAHIDLCVATDRPVADAGIARGVILGGRCAVLRITGSGNDLETGFGFLYREWLPVSGEEMRDFPPYCRRITMVPDVAEHEYLLTPL